MLKRLLRPLKRSLYRAKRRRKPIILMYHRIGAEGEDPWALAVSPQHFAEHLDVLRRHRRVIGLHELVNRLAAGELPMDCAVVTFDDGYASNLYLAKPQLERFATPASVFVTTEAIDREDEFYWDELGRLLLQPGSLPTTLRLEIDGKTHEWNLRHDTNYSPADAVADAGWRALEPPPTERHTLYVELWRLSRALSSGAREKVLMRLRDWADVDSRARPDRRTLTASELMALAEGGLIEIGAHSVTHESLAGKPATILQNEVHCSKTQLGKWLGRPVTIFAYPYGDHDDASAAAVRAAGFSCACTTLEDMVYRDSDPFRLPRFQVHDWDGDEFTRRLLAR